MTAPRQHTHPSRRRRHPRGSLGLVMAPPDPSVTRIAGPWRHFHVHASGIRFQCVESVPDGNPSAGPPRRCRSSSFCTVRLVLVVMAPPAPQVSVSEWSPSICADTAVVTNRPGVRRLDAGR